MSLVPNHFLFRLAHPCRYLAGIPLEEGDQLLDLPEECRIDNFAALDARRNFADVRMGWNEFGLAIQAEVRGKDQSPRGDADRPRGSDGLTLWIDTRDARTSHRASRYCHQFHFLPAGGGPERDEPVFVQTKINRALQDSPLAAASAVPFGSSPVRGGYLLEAFLSASVLNGYDPEQNPRLGFFYALRDAELGEQTLGIGSEFPYWEDPTLWHVLQLSKAGER